MTTRTFARWVGLPFGVAAISTSGVLIRLTTAPPLVTAAVRMVVTSALLLAVALIRHQDELRRLDSPTLRLMVGGGLLLGVHFALWTNALFWTSVASAVLLVDTHPVAVALAARFFLGEVTPRQVWIGIGITLAGSLLVAAGDLEFGGRALVGDLMAASSAAMFAGYLVIGRHVRQGMSLPVYTGIVYGVATLALFVMIAVMRVPLTSVTGQDLVVWGLLVLFPTLGGHTVLNWALRHVPAAVVGVSMLAEPVLTTTWAWLVLGEPPSPTAVIGGAVILTGLYIALRAPADRAAPPVPGGLRSTSGKDATGDLPP